MNPVERVEIIDWGFALLVHSHVEVVFVADEDLQEVVDAVGGVLLSV